MAAKQTAWVKTHAGPWGKVRIPDNLRGDEFVRYCERKGYHVGDAPPEADAEAAMEAMYLPPPESVVVSKPTTSEPIRSRKAAPEPPAVTPEPAPEFPEPPVPKAPAPKKRGRPRKAV